MDKKIICVNLQELFVAPIGPDGAEGTSFEKVPVIHQDTFTYEEDDPEVTEYKDVAGNTYYTSKRPGAVRINASIGKYDLKTKQKFQGGKYEAGSDSAPNKWARPDAVANIEFTVKAKTEDGVYVVFPRASVTASGKSNEKAIGLSLVFTALKPEKDDLPIEYWLDGEPAGA